MSDSDVLSAAPTGAAAPRRLLQLVCVAAAVCLAGTFWAHAARDTCDSCGAANDLLGGTGALSLLGVVFYSALLAAASFSLTRLSRAERHDRAASTSGSAAGRLRFVLLPAVGMLAAAGVHLALGVLLVRNHIACPPCILTAVAALVGATGVLVSQREQAVRGLIIVGLMFVATTGAAKILRPGGDFWTHRAAVRAAQSVLAATPRLPAGSSRIVAYIRPGCPHCEHYAREVLPPVQSSNAGHLQTETRLAPGRLKTPTVVVLGAVNTVFDGCPTTQDLQLAVRQARGTAARTERTSMGIPFSRP